MQAPSRSSTTPAVDSTSRATSATAPNAAPSPPLAPSDVAQVQAPPPEAEEFVRPNIGDRILYTLDGNEVYPGVVLKVHTEHDVDIHVFGRERHGMAFERVFVERGAVGDVGKWAPLG